MFFCWGISFTTCVYLLCIFCFIRFVTGSKPGHHTGFDIDEADLKELEQPHEVIVASAIFGIEDKTAQIYLKGFCFLHKNNFFAYHFFSGNYDIIQQPRNVSEAARKNVPFYMFIDEETEAYMRNSSVLDSSKRVGLWRIILVHNIPYTDARRNGKVSSLVSVLLFSSFWFMLGCALDNSWLFCFCCFTVLKFYCSGWTEFGLWWYDMMQLNQLNDNGNIKNAWDCT